ncbi:MAG: metalloregulator ArsR/SmtB family transcription factor [Candidatus Altiarchaeota archaeon]|nr:metalloregulator ArsR/SmtB family transcription factor [Candidatus Altiarchaeota archaeon]
MESVERQVKVFKALGDPTRLMIVKMLAKCEKCVCEIIPATGKSQPTTSAHLKVLHEAGLLKSRKDGLSVYYRIADESVRGLIKAAEKIK